MMHTHGMIGQRDYDAIVIGAGVIASAIAYELSRRGHRILSVDKGSAAGFYVAMRTSGNQFTNTGVAGHGMAELIEAVRGGHDYDADPLEVTGRFTGLDLDLGAYSRNREINLDSSFSVNG